MKSKIRKLGKILLYILCVILVLVIVVAIYHNVMLKIEENKIIPNGKIVEVNDHKIHVYSEGVSSEKPTLIFMSGSGTVAPVYDFKSLYSKLSDKYKIVVIERIGYGYSEIIDAPRDIETILEETRGALNLAGEEGPYVLLPHSISGIEALYWAQQYPEEVKGIIGLDMAVPESYDYFDFKSTDKLIKIGQLSSKLGLLRLLPSIYPLNNESLTEEEIQQQKYLMYRNAINLNYALEGKEVYNNSRIVLEGEKINVPILLFVSNGEGIGDYWIPSQEKFAKEVNGEIIYLETGHYIHYTESKTIADKSLEFLDLLK